ncbi:MAG: DUF2283 domain-containing protein, partial [Chloroflexota bacterium]
MRPLLEYDEAGDAAYVTFSEDEWHHQQRLDDGRAINYCADGTVIGVELLSPKRKGVRLEGLPYPTEIARVMRSVGFRILEAAR